MELIFLKILVIVIMLLAMMDICLAAIEIGDRCSKNRECSSNGLDITCNDGICSCLSSQIYSSEEKICLSTVGEKCLLNSPDVFKCVKNTECKLDLNSRGGNFGICHCLNTFIRTSKGECMEKLSPERSSWKTNQFYNHTSKLPVNSLLILITSVLFIMIHFNPIST